MDVILKTNAIIVRKVLSDTELGIWWWNRWIAAPEIWYCVDFCCLGLRYGGGFGYYIIIVLKNTLFDNGGNYWAEVLNFVLDVTVGVRDWKKDVVFQMCPIFVRGVLHFFERHRYKHSPKYYICFIIECSLSGFELMKPIPILYVQLIWILHTDWKFASFKLCLILAEFPYRGKFL